MKKTLRGFGIGVFLVGALLSFGSNNSSFHSSSEENKLKKEIATLEKQLTIANGEIEKLKNSEKEVSSINEVEQVNVNNETSSKVQPNKENNVISGTVLIYEGMSIYDIGKQVEDIGVLTNGRELELFLSKPEYSRSIQKGQFELDSTMTIEQMARIITGKKIQ